MLAMASGAVLMQRQRKKLLMMVIPPWCRRTIRATEVVASTQTARVAIRQATFATRAGRKGARILAMASGAVLMQRQRQKLLMMMVIPPWCRRTIRATEVVASTQTARVATRQAIFATRAGRRGARILAMASG